MKWLLRTILFCIGIMPIVGHCEDETARILTFELRSGQKLHGTIIQSSPDSYQIFAAQKGICLIPISKLKTMIFDPSVDVTILDAVTKRMVIPVQTPSKNEAFKLAIEAVKKERHETRNKRLENASVAAEKLGLEGMVDQVTAKAQDRLMDAFIEDKEIQNILLDNKIQKMIESGDIMSLMNNPKILNLMRNRDKVNKLMQHLLGDEDGKEKKDQEVEGEKQ